MASSEIHGLVSRLSLLGDVTENNQSPIAGYEKVSFVNIETAIQPLLTVVEQIDQMIDNAKKNSSKQASHLSLDERAAIHLYTQAWSLPEKSFYTILNRVLRDGNRDRLKCFFPYLKLLISALLKIPAERRHVYRGVKQDLAAGYQQGQTYYWWSFTSCTTSVAVLQQELFLGKEGTRTMFDIECHNGRDISAFSAIVKENEVLLLPGFHFKVKGTLDAGNGLIIIQIEEINTQPIPSQVSNEKLEQTIAACQPPKLNLNMRSVKDQDMHIVIRRVFGENSFKILDLSCNELTDYALRILSTALQNNRELEELNLAQNAISDVGIENLALVLNSTALKRLDLSTNEIHDQGVQHLATMLGSNNSLVDVSLRFNQVTDIGLRALIHVLSSTNASLESLNLSANERIGDASIESLKDMIKHNRSLKKLDLRSCNFSKEGRIQISSEARSNRQLKMWI